MLMRALTDHRTVSAFVNNREFLRVRNQKETRTVAKAVDCLIDELGMWHAKDSKAALACKVSSMFDVCCK